MTNEKQRAALISIAASVGLTLAKAAVGLATGSLAILSEAAHSLIDVAATVMTYFAVRIADKPADEEHHYGHGKVESIAALAETALLFLLSGVVMWEAGKRLLGEPGHVVQATAAAFVVIVGSITVDFFRARALLKAARDHSSEALEADALHFSSDMWSSVAVLFGLVGLIFGYSWADAAAAAVVALFVCHAGWQLARRNIGTLTDMVPRGIAGEITDATNKVKGVVGVERVRARQVGPKLFVELDVAVSRTLPLGRVDILKLDVAESIRAELPNAEVTVNVTPRALSDETVMERVMVIARNRAVAVHHVTVHAISGRLSVSLDLEVDGALSLSAAHEIASGLETAIRDELGPEVEVESHIEPLQTHGLAGHDASAGRVEEVHKELRGLAATLGMPRNIHDVRVRETIDGEIVNFHCDVDPNLRVSDVHEMVDEVERGLRRRFPAIKRVIGHAEPRLDRTTITA